MYFEIGASLNSSNSQMFLGLMHFYGRGVKNDIAKAKKYFELSAKQKNSVANLQLGYIYLSEKNYTKAIEYLNMSGKLNNSIALLYLGIIHFMGNYVCKDISKAINCWEQSAKLENPIAYLYLGDCYLDYGVKGYSLAKKHYNIAAQYNIPEAFYSIGILYYYGLGVDKNYNEAKKYFEKATHGFIHPRALFKLGIMHIRDSNDKNCIPRGLSYLKLAAKYKNIDALSYLGNMYYSGIIFDVDCQKAIEYFLECTKYYNEKVLIYSNIFDEIIQKRIYNQYRYTSLNNIGLIYLINMNNLDEAIKFIKEAAFAEYQHGQNNWGLIHQKYLNDIEKAKYWFQRPSEHNFALSEYNLGFLYEKEGKTDKSIGYYLRASDDISNPFIFQDYLYNDERLNISSLFIICLANLLNIFFSNKEYDISKKYFIRSLYKIVNKNYRKFMFKLVNDEAKECFSHIKSLYLNFPLFNLQNTNLLSKTDLSSNINESENECKIMKSKNYDEIAMIHKMCKKQKLDGFAEIENRYCQEINENKCIVFDDPEKLFDFIVEDEELKKVFIDEIRDIIHCMDKILDTPPYAILFGRIDISKPRVNHKKNYNDSLREINDLFHEGFAMDI